MQETPHKHFTNTEPGQSSTDSQSEQAWKLKDFLLRKDDV